MFAIGDELETVNAPRVALTQLQNSDADTIFMIYSDPEAMRYWSTVAMTDRAEAEALIESIHRLFAERSLLQWGVVRRSDARLIGTVTLASLDARNMRADLGFMLSRDCWGQGYMREALVALLNYAFDKLGLKRLEADVDPLNAASLGLLQRLGFQREGLLRERWRVGDGIQDSVILGLLSREWRAAADSKSP